MSSCGAGSAEALDEGTVCLALRKVGLEYNDGLFEDLEGYMDTNLGRTQL